MLDVVAIDSEECSTNIFVFVGNVFWQSEVFVEWSAMES